MTSKSTSSPSPSDTSSPPRILPVIMCGGSGTRLWPASRESMPKQFIPLLEDLSNFQVTAKRFSHPAFLKPLVLASNDVRFIVAEQLQAVGVEAEIALEPMRRDSAAAVAVAACLAERHGAGTVALVVASDHLISDMDAFVASCITAAEGARAGFVMTLGVTPTTPATGYGYIHPGSSIAGTGAYRVERFVEKPDASTAARYIDQGYLWNSGNFLFRYDVMIAELEVHASAVLAAARLAVEAAKSDLDFLRLRRRSLHQGAEGIHRLCRDGAYRDSGRIAGRIFVVRHRHLGRDLGRVEAGRQRERAEGQGRGRRNAQQPRPLGRRAHHRGGARRRGGGGDARRRLGDVAQPLGRRKGPRQQDEGGSASGRSMITCSCTGPGAPTSASTSDRASR